MVTVSTVTPVYNGAAYIYELIAGLDRVRQNWAENGLAYTLVEAIFVDDGSTDESLHVLQRLAQVHDWIKVVVLSRNFGQHAATIAGILHTSGDWICTLDEDLQHNPADMQFMLMEAEKHSYDIIYGKPLRQSVVHSVARDSMSRLAKGIVKSLTGNRFVAEFSSFRMIRGTLARSTASVSGHDPYLDTALCWFTERIGTVHVEMVDTRVLSGKVGGV